MNVRRLTAALATSCLCLAANAADAQTRPVGPPNLLLPNDRAAIVDVRSAGAPAAPDSFRLRPDDTGQARSSNMLQSWAMDGGGEVGLGRFTVSNSARPRTHTERLGGGIDPETRRIAGAGMQIRF